MTAPKPAQLTTGTDEGASTSPVAQPAPQPGRYEIDTTRSAVTFRTRHMFGLAPVRGSFTIRAGTVDVAGPLTDPGIYAEIEAASFRTGNGQRDSNVRSARLLAAGQHPVITFRSGHMDGLALTGTLTVRDVTRPVSLSIEQSAVSSGSFTARATTRIDRTQFGVTAYRGLAGRYLDMTVDIRCVHK
jgi:polyisoprenoid-binding protein YceI